MDLDRLHREATPQALAALRVLVFGVWFLEVLLDPIRGLSALPGSMLQSVGFLAFVPEAARSALLSPSFLTLLWLTLLLLTAAAAVAAFPRVILPLTAVALVVYQTLVRGFGHINHAELAILYAAILLALFPCADAWSVTRRRSAPPEPAERYGDALFAMAAMLCTTYLFTGAHRVVTGFPDAFSPDTLRLYTLLNVYEWPHHVVRVSQTMASSTLWGYSLSAGTVVVTILEVLAPLCLLSRRFRVVFAVVMLAFHLFAMLIFNVQFWQNCVLYVVFVDARAWPALGERVLAGMRRLRKAPA